MKVKSKDRLNRKLKLITPKTLIGGVDIAKHIQWARFVDYRGIEIGGAVRFSNDKNGFEDILTSIRRLCKEYRFKHVVIGMEPTGHYWKALANFLMKQRNITVVLVNPYATKRVKELDDNSPTKSDKKDSLTIAKLVKDGRYFETYLPHDIYANLRVLSTTRQGLNKRKSAVKNTITAIMDEYFPEFTSVFKHPLKGKASRHLMKTLPFPGFILEAGEEGVLEAVKAAVKKTVGRKKVQLLLETAATSVGVDYGEEAARFKLRQMVEELDLLDSQTEELEAKMEQMLEQVPHTKYLLSVKGFGIVTLATCLGELGDPLRFDDPKQMARMAGYNLTEDSSGKNKSGTCISKRGRKALRCVLYQMALTMVAVNPEMKRLYHYLKTRKENPLKKVQALVVISKKILTLIYTLSKKQEMYKPKKVFGVVRKKQFAKAA